MNATSRRWRYLTAGALLLTARLCAQQPPADLRERGIWNEEFQAARNSSKPAAESAPMMLGVTAWRLRESRTGDRARILVHENTARRTLEYTPERIGLDTYLKYGDLIRITVEPARSGYLYIASRELYKDGKTGPAALIFPSRRIRGGRTHVSPGEIVDIPEVSNGVPFLTIERGSHEESGEQIFLLLVDREIPGMISEGTSTQFLPEGTLPEWMRKWGDGVRKLDAPSAKGAALTEMEHAAASGSIRLRPQDPVPQVLFRTPASSKGGLMAEYTLHLRP